MTYRVGAYVWDPAEGKVGEVRDERLGRVYLRPPCGGLEWAARPKGLRLATKEERKEAGVVEPA
ncbi:hypothetical protein [Streptomyces glebosus]|uniref:hypothetical protein n=1 Tax=Streptomyces glebosus TaxID=249580 RepID=UPI001E6066AE|nr:hypothetical protein [Streptomyces glebosus]